MPFSPCALSSACAHITGTVTSGLPLMYTVTEALCHRLRHLQALATRGNIGRVSMREDPDRPRLFLNHASLTEISEVGLNLLQLPQELCQILPEIFNVHHAQQARGASGVDQRLRRLASMTLSAAKAREIRETPASTTDTSVKISCFSTYCICRTICGDKLQRVEPRCQESRY